MNTDNFDRELVLEIENTLGIKFKDRKKLYSCFLHSMYLNEIRDTDSIEEKKYLSNIGKSLLKLSK